MKQKNETSAHVQTGEFIRGSKALAEWLGVSEVSVRRAVRKHVLPVIRFGGALLFRRSEVEKTLARLTVPSVSMVKATATEG